MKTNLVLTALLATILSFTISCKKENKNTKTSEIYLPKFLDYYNSHPHDSTTIANMLIGTWNWKEQSCMNNFSAASPGKVVKATFSSSGTYSVSENSSVIAHGNWQIKMISSNTTYELVIDQPCGYLYGLIYPCDNQVLFCASNVDGCNTLFEKE